MWVQKCDICGLEKKIERFRYKVKVKKEAFSWEDHWWAKLDSHLARLVLHLRKAKRENR